MNEQGALLFFSGKTLHAFQRVWSRKFAKIFFIVLRKRAK